MPRITFRDYQAGSRPWWEYVGDAGNAVAEGLRQQHKDTREDAELAQEKDLKQRALAIEEERAKANLLRESNLASARNERQVAQDADRQAAVQGLKELAGQRQAEAFQENLDKAIGSHGGALGPFGIFGAIGTSAAASLAQSQEEFAPKVALAQDMSPAGARMYLEQQQKEAHARIIGKGYQKEAEDLAAGLAEGWIPPAIGKELSDLMQQRAAAHLPPGAVHQRIVKLHDMARQQKVRAAGWEDADHKAAELIGVLEKMADSSELPATRAAMRQKVADAKGEWARTLPLGNGEESKFRNENEARASLAALEEILFGAQATADVPMGIEYTPDRSKLLEWRAQNPLSKEQIRPGGAPVPKSKLAPQPAKPQAPRKLTGKDDEKALRDFVTDNARMALKGDVRSGVLELLRRIHKEHGLDPNSPEVLSIVKDQLERIRGGTGQPKKPKKAG